MSQGIINLHNHTPFSDGAYTIDEIVAAHLDKDFDVAGVGISDHLFCTPSSREIKHEKEFDRVFGKEARDYVRMVQEARQNWSDKVPVYCGAEINWPLNKTMLEQIRRMIQGIDYVMFEFVDWAGLTQLANQARRWPCPVILGNTDIASQFPNTSMDQVVRTLANARIIYELNSKQMPLSLHERWFRILPNHRVQISLGTDTHDDLRCIKDLPQLHEFVLGHGLEQKLFQPHMREEETVEASR